MEKIIVRHDGTKYKITLELRFNNWRGTGISYEAKVSKCEAGKRKFIPLLNGDDWEYRQQPFPHGRDKWEQALYLKHVTADEIYQAKLEAWELLKPTN